MKGNYARQLFEIKANGQAEYDTDGETRRAYCKVLYLKTVFRLNLWWLKHNSPAMWSEIEAMAAFKGWAEGKGSQRFNYCAKLTLIVIYVVI